MILFNSEHVPQKVGMPLTFSYTLFSTRKNVTRALNVTVGRRNARLYKMKYCYHEEEHIL